MILFLRAAAGSRGQWVRIMGPGQIMTSMFPSTVVGCSVTHLRPEPFWVRWFRRGVNPKTMISGRDLYVADDLQVLRYNGTTGAFPGIFVPFGSGGLG